MEQPNFSWAEMPPIINAPVADGDIRLVNLPVQCLFEYCKEIACEWDEEGNVIETTEGYIMRVIPDQEFLFNNQPTQYLAHSIKQ